MIQWMYHYRYAALLRTIILFDTPVKPAAD
jgi:hypothetical protein